MNIGEQISKAIKECKWLDISYINKKGETTHYWISIEDIDFNKRSFKVNMFNDSKSLNTLKQWIFYDSIKSARVIDFSFFDTPNELLEKIERNLDRCVWLNYDHFNYNILNYYAECNILDSDPFQKDYQPIKGIDLRQLRKNKVYNLTEEQELQIIKDIYKYDLKKLNNSHYELAVNCLSISKGNQKYVLCYYSLKFDPKKKQLVLIKTLRFNKSFQIEGRRHSLFNYVNMDMDTFTSTFEENYKEYVGIISENLRVGEKIDTMPDIMLLTREIPVDLEEVYSVIDDKYKNNELPIPLKSFFGNISKRNNVRKKEPSIIIYDKNININQMRVLYNAMKYPVTYVQGPPGTGKTQTILNVVLSAFFNDKTTLVCSSNNKPVDGIVEKLKFEYRGQTIGFPYLRLGNFEDVKKATKSILDIYNFETTKEPQEDKLGKIKANNDDNNTKLISMLNHQEKRVDIETCLENSNKLIKSFGNQDSNIIKTVKEKINQLEKELENYPEIDNKEIISLFEPLKENHKLSQYLFFKSLQYTNKLKKPRYNELINICNIIDDGDRASEFNKWLQDDDNMKKLVEVFPIIFSTNISTRRLGSPKFMFNMVIMDEAGQCNVATALIPIAKAENLLMVGDRNQLRPVIILENEVNQELKAKYHISNKYDYKTNSILDVMIENDNISKYILLKYHYRCGKKIINFSNKRYYDNALNLSALNREGSLELIDVKNNNVKQKNEAYDEASAIVDYIKRNKVEDAYIITPFVNQKELINKLLFENNIKNIECGTIHSMQGAEKNTIIFSPAISLKTSKKTYEWIKNNHEIINVGITRAKNKLVVAADTECINSLSNKDDDLYNLIKYIKSNGTYNVPLNEKVKIEIGKSNSSAAEDEFFKTISHFCSVYKTFDASRNVKLSKLFKEDASLSSSNLEFDLVLYKKNIFQKKPIIAFEVNGGEHLGTVSREKSDRIKMDICKRKDIQLIFIPNSFVKAYEYIADILLSSKDKNCSIQQTLFEYL